MFPFLEFKNFVISQRKFLVFWLLRVLFVFTTFSYALRELEEFSKQNFSLNRSPIIYAIAILQFLFIFVCVYFFRKELDPGKSVSLEEYFLFLLRGLLVFMVVVVLFVGVLFGIGYLFKTFAGADSEPSVYAKLTEVILILLLFPTLVLYSSIANSRLHAVLRWKDVLSAVKDRFFQWVAFLLLFLSVLIFLVPILFAGFPNPEDLESQYKYAKIRLYIEILPFLLAEVSHLALVFFFVRTHGGVEPEEPEEFAA